MYSKLVSRKIQENSQLQTFVKRNCHTNNQSGQTLIELIVVSAVSVIVIGALVFATIASLRNSQFSKYQAQATKLAQEGIEEVRSARDRNATITGLSGVNSWYGTGSPSQPIWSYSISGNCASPSNEYFKIMNSQGTLNFIGCSNTFPAGAEDPIGDGKFKRIVILSDDSTFGTQKTVTVIVKWTDFSGDHQSQLTTILSNTTQ